MTTVNKPAVKAMATALAAALCAQLAYAVTPTAVWSKNLGQSYTIDGKTYAITPRNGTLNQDGTITVSSTWGHKAPYIDMDGQGVGTISILVKYSGLDITQIYDADASSIGVAFASIIDSDTNVVGSCIQKGNNTVRAYYCAASASQAQPMAIGSMTAVEGAGYLLFSYKDSEGSRTYMGTSVANLTGGQDTAGHWSGRTLKKIVLGGDESGKAFNGAGFKIEGVALFVNEYYTASDVASYEFPAKIYSSDVNVSTINTDFPDASEIDVYLDDGVTVTGDTTFTATKVNFHCDGSFNMTPPPSNEATFDFSGVTGRPVLIYSAPLSVSGSKFTSNVIPTFVTDSTKWRGVIYISSGTFTDFTSNEYGNESSVVRLGNVSGWLSAPGNYAFTNTVPVELVGTLTINNGNSANDSNPNKCTVFKKLSGSGTISTDTTANKVVVVIQDASEFTGNIALNGKLIVFGDAMPSYIDNNKFDNMTGSIWVMEGASVTTQPASGIWWAVGGIKLAGELRASGLDKFGGGTYITTSDTGVFTLTSTGNPSDASETDTSYARITGTGALKYEGTGWRALSTTYFPTNMTLINEQAGDILLSRPQTYTIGSLAGSKNFQGNYGSGDRYLRVLQAKDTEWSGKIVYDYYERFKGLIVAPGVSTNGTLTLSGTQTQSRTLTVESGAKVNITGTWVGPTTVSGTLSGTGTVNGALTLADGSTLIANTADPLTVSSLSLPATGTVTISLADSDIGKDFISSSSSIDTTGKKFAFTVNGEPTNLTVIKTAGGLKAVLPGMKIIFR